MSLIIYCTIYRRKQYQDIKPFPLKRIYGERENKIYYLERITKEIEEMFKLKMIKDRDNNFYSKVSRQEINQYMNSHEGVELLVSCGCDILRRDGGEYMETFLIRAVRNNDFKLVEKMIRGKCDIDKRAEDGSTALMIAFGSIYRSY